MTKIGPCKISRKFSTNAYGIELPQGISFSHIFNIVHLCPFKGKYNNLNDATVSDKNQISGWESQLPKAFPKEIEVMLD